MKYLQIDEKEPLGSVDYEMRKVVSIIFAEDRSADQVPDLDIISCEKANDGHLIIHVRAAVPAPTVMKAYTKYLGETKRLRSMSPLHLRLAQFALRRGCEIQPDMMKEWNDLQPDTPYSSPGQFKRDCLAAAGRVMDRVTFAMSRPFWDRYKDNKQENKTLSQNQILKELAEKCDLDMKEVRSLFIEFNKMIQPGPSRDED